MVEPHHTAKLLLARPHPLAGCLRHCTSMQWSVKRTHPPKKKKKKTKKVCAGAEEEGEAGDPAGAEAAQAHASSCRLPHPGRLPGPLPRSGQRGEMTTCWTTAISRSMPGKRLLTAPLAAPSHPPLSHPPLSHPPLSHRRLGRTISAQAWSRPALACPGGQALVGPGILACCPTHASGPGPDGTPCSCLSCLAILRRGVQPCGGQHRLQGMVCIMDVVVLLPHCMAETLQGHLPRLRPARARSGHAQPAKAGAAQRYSPEPARPQKAAQGQFKSPVAAQASAALVAGTTSSGMEAGGCPPAPPLCMSKTTHLMQPIDGLQTQAFGALPGWRMS